VQNLAGFDAVFSLNLTCKMMQVLIFCEFDLKILIYAHLWVVWGI